MSWKNLFPKENRYCETDLGILYCGDCLELVKDFPCESIDLVLTDPPYGVQSNELNGIDYKDNFYNVRQVSSELYRVLRNDTRAYIFSAQKTFIEVVTSFINNGFNLHQVLIWYRPNLLGGTRKKTYDFTSVYEQILNFHKGKPLKIKKVNEYHNIDVLKYAMPQGNFKKDKRFHIHQKPLELVKHIITVSTNEYDIILDSFAGVGTTAVACEQLKRRWLGIEINSSYCKIAKERIKSETHDMKLFTTKNIFFN